MPFSSLCHVRAMMRTATAGVHDRAFDTTLGDRRRNENLRLLHMSDRIKTRDEQSGWRRLDATRGRVGT